MTELTKWKCDTCHRVWYQHVLWPKSVLDAGVRHETGDYTCYAQLFENGIQVGRCQGQCTAEVVDTRPV